MTQLRLETDRLLVRRFVPGDWQDLYEYLSREDVVKYEPYGAADAEQCKEEATRRAADQAFWAVCLKPEGKMIGNLYFQKQNNPFDTWELGFVFNPDYQGRGYAAEASRRLLTYGFEELDVRRAVAHCNQQNESSWRLLERLGFRRESCARQTVFFQRDAQGKPLWHDTYSYGMLQSEWENKKKIAIARAGEQDAPELIRVQNRCFYEDYLAYGQCPAYREPPEKMRQMIRDVKVYKITDLGEIVGDIIVRPLGNGRYYLRVLCVLPQYQNCGIGQMAVRHIEKDNPDAQVWELITPEKSLRNHHFYEKMGYVKVRQEAVSDCLSVFFYRKEIKAQ